MNFSSEIAYASVVFLQKNVILGINDAESSERNVILGINDTESSERTFQAYVNKIMTCSQLWINYTGRDSVFSFSLRDIDDGILDWPDLIRVNSKLIVTVSIRMSLRWRLDQLKKNNRYK